MSFDDKTSPKKVAFNAPLISPATPSPADCTTAQLEYVLRPITINPSSRQASFVNWAGTYKCRPSRVFAPFHHSQLPYIFELARREKTTVRAAGAGHSPSDLACTSGFMVRTDGLNAVLEVSFPK